jgi:dolichol-phosphate mannosyltransferase
MQREINFGCLRNETDKINFYHPIYFLSLPYNKIAMSRISITIPVYNEQENIHKLFVAIEQAMLTTGCDYEIIFIDDASTDNSINIIKKLAKENHNVKYLSFSRNFGQQAAFTAGLDFATGDAVISLDADLQDPPELIPEMIKKWEQGYDIVFMRRKNRHDGVFKRATAGAYYYLLHKFSDRKFEGNIGDFRLIGKNVVDELKNFREKSRYLRGMVFWVGYKQAYIDYDRPNRKDGKSGFSFLKMVRLAMSGILNFSLLPLRLGLLVGMFVVIVGFLFLAYITFDTVLNDVVYQLYKWLSVVTFIFTGFLFILIWILGEYIGKIYDEVKDRPIYLIREKGIPEVTLKKGKTKKAHKQFVSLTGS